MEYWIKIKITRRENLTEDYNALLLSVVKRNFGAIIPFEWMHFTYSEFEIGGPQPRIRSFEVPTACRPKVYANNGYDDDNDNNTETGSNWHYYGRVKRL